MSQRTPTSPERAGSPELARRTSRNPLSVGPGPLLFLAAYVCGRVLISPPWAVASPGARTHGIPAASAHEIPAAPAHEIPSDVTVRAFVKPEGHALRFLVRVPLEAMRDMEFAQRGQGYLDLAAVDPQLRDAARLWISSYVAFYEEGRRLEDPLIVAARIALPSDRSFSSYEDALELIGSPRLRDDIDLPWQQALLDVLFEYPIASDTSRFSIDPGFAHLGLRTITALRFLPPGRAERAFEYAGDPGIVRLDPRWHQAALRFVRLGFTHILDGLDHLLFLFCLIIPLRSLRGLFPVVTSFTVAHSITLIASAFGLAPRTLWFPPLIETLIALSIVYMALENIVGARPERRWLLAFGFGLVHGFGFSFALGESLQFAGAHLLTSLLSFNVGVELGQVFVLILAVPVIEFAFRKVIEERMGTIIISAILAHSGWHWMTERGSTLLAYDFSRPVPDLTLLATLMRWLMLALIIGGVIWLLRGPFGRMSRAAHREPRPERASEVPP